MKKDVSKKPSVVEMEIKKERVTRPVSFEVQYPTLYDGCDVEVNVTMYIHNGSQNTKGDTDNITLVYPRDNLAPKLYAIEKLDEALKIQEISRISRLRDSLFSRLNIKLTTMFDETDCKDRLDKYDEIVNAIYHNDEVRHMLKGYVFAETLLKLARKQKVFHSEEIQSLFA